MAGGIWRLLGVVSAHRGAIEYDFRHRFGLGLRDVGGALTIAEAARLVTQLLADPSSAVYAAAAGWDYPLSIEALILLDQFDLEHMSAWARGGGKGRRPKPHPLRPDDKTTEAQRFGDTGGRTREEIVAILNAHGHSLAA